MHRDERRHATAEGITSGRLPIPRWVTVRPGSRAAGKCDGCGDGIENGDYTFTVVVQDALTFHFHDECFDVYNRFDYQRGS